jgi:hypothetical protein
VSYVSGARDESHEERKVILQGFEERFYEATPFSTFRPSGNHEGRDM